LRTLAKDILHDYFALNLTGNKMNKFFKSFYPLIILVLTLSPFALSAQDLDYQDQIIKERFERDNYFKNHNISPFTMIGREVLPENLPIRVTLPGDTLLIAYPGADIGVPTLEFIYKKSAGIVYVRTPLGGDFYKGKRRIGPIPLELFNGDSLRAEKFWLKVYEGSNGMSLAAYDPEKSNNILFNDFPVSEEWKVEAKIKHYDEQKTITLATSTGKTREYYYYAQLLFLVKGKEFQLTMFTNSFDKDAYAFIPFSDESNGVETYPAGRYIDMKLPSREDKTVIIDFNKAYNPYCAYSKFYDCPIPPAENHISITVEAGEKKYH